MGNKVWGLLPQLSQLPNMQDGSKQAPGLTPVHNSCPQTEPGLATMPDKTVSPKTVNQNKSFGSGAVSRR